MVDRIAEGQARLEAERKRRQEAREAAFEKARREPDPRTAAAFLTAALQDLVSQRAVPWVSDEQVAAWEAEEAIRERRSRLHDSGILGAIDHDVPGALDMARRIVTDTADATPALDIVRRWLPWVERPENALKNTLVILGDVGIGKTVAAAWALARRSGRYVSSDELSRLWRAHEGIERRGFGYDADTWPKVMDTRLLVIDEVTDEEDEAGAMAALGEVLDKRRGCTRLTIILGNATKQKLRKRLNARAVDRIRRGVIMRIEGQSLRTGRALDV